MRREKELLEETRVADVLYTRRFSLQLFDGWKSGAGYFLVQRLVLGKPAPKDMHKIVHDYIREQKKSVIRDQKVLYVF